ncbi:hypothetical protein FGG08_007678, partial [Glutinoglossum americanum]
PLQQDVGYDGVRDFTWIASLAEVNFGVVVPADSTFKTWKDLLAWSRANPMKVTYGCPAGLGNSAHLFGSEVAAREKADWIPVPFRASPDCMTALMGGQLTFAIDTLISAAPQVRNGKVRLLALATAQRSRLWPEVPTMLELGYETLIESPVGVGGPAGMPPQIVQQLQDAFKFASEQPAFLGLLEQSGARPWYMPAAEYRRFAERAEQEQRTLLTKLDGKIALVTGCGASGPGWGNGKAIATLFARQGANVYGIDLKLEAAQATREVVQGEGGTMVVQAGDVTRDVEVRNAVAACLATFGRIDILVNNVGRSEPGDPISMQEDTWDAQFDVNLKSAFLTCKHVLPLMVAQGSGAVVNVSSVAGLRYIGKPQ